MKKQALIADLVKDVIKKLGPDERPGEEQIKSEWEKAVGKAASKHARPVSFRKSTLLVNVDASGWLYDLTTKKKEILKKLDLRFKGRKPKDIRFRIGDVNPAPSKR